MTPLGVKSVTVGLKQLSLRRPQDSNIRENEKITKKSSGFSIMDHDMAPNSTPKPSPQTDSSQRVTGASETLLCAELHV